MIIVLIGATGKPRHPGATISACGQTRCLLDPRGLSEKPRSRDFQIAIGNSTMLDADTRLETAPTTNHSNRLLGCRGQFEEGAHTGKERVGAFMPKVTAFLEHDELDLGGRQSAHHCLSRR